VSSLTLEEQHDVRNAEAWFPHKPAGKDQPRSIAGELVSLDSVWSDYHETFKVLAVIRAEDRCWSVRTYPTRLHDEWCRQAPQVGERVGIRFTGMLERKKDGKPYPDYTVAVERDGPPPAFDYGRVGGPSSDVEPEPTDAPASPEQPVAAPAGDRDIPF
jgi:hypothetical protein